MGLLSAFQAFQPHIIQARLANTNILDDVLILQYQCIVRIRQKESLYTITV